MSEDAKSPNGAVKQVDNQASTVATVLVDGVTVLIDAEDLCYFQGRKTWHVSVQGVKSYLKWQTSTKGVRKTIFFHRLVMDAVDGQTVDHINGDSLDNRKSNLRFVDKSQNARNSRKISARKTSSRFKGVSLHKGGWRVRIRTDSGMIYLGRHADEVAAAYAYDCASLKYHGEYGCRNFLPLA